MINESSVVCLHTSKVYVHPDRLNCDFHIRKFLSFIKVIWQSAIHSFLALVKSFCVSWPDLPLPFNKDTNYKTYAVIRNSLLAELYRRQSMMVLKCTGLSEDVNKHQTLLDLSSLAQASGISVGGAGTIKSS